MHHPLHDYYKEEKPWGSFETFILNEPCTVKFLHVDAGTRFSLQKHAKREEFWRCVKGSGTAIIADKEILLMEGSEVLIPIGTTHRLSGGSEGITVLEITLGTHDEGDVERLEDDFGRV